MSKSHTPQSGALKSPPPTFAIILTGDGLWTPLATAVSEGLGLAGIKSTRIKSLHYFWSAQSPKTLMLDLAAMMKLRRARRPKCRFILIGYSFGAGTLPFAANLLGPAMIGAVDLAVLIAPPAHADFKFLLRSWLNKSSPDARPVAPQIAALSDKLPVLYLRGQDDYIGPSEVIAPHDKLKLTTLPGGHDLNGDYDTIARLICERLDALQNPGV
ncbi:AcvB/VirJ family lysyl-phosphatidylglycerol hydrolase [Robiginitomaculum antarcticum]|uniref:AcvB/VirJ family lysyl-phosphatidylglycerol hydrolase n=1 Tax=Robiginitomaculum antarcticum TaxID=437507 RepID=UPI00035DACD9|nr:AcvB/VirJ family lysyl-phosphatidylglycerol hydrolase [Robiginitomaculum antarcticum]